MWFESHRDSGLVDGRLFLMAAGLDAAADSARGRDEAAKRLARGCDLLDALWAMFLMLAVQATVESEPRMTLQCTTPYTCIYYAYSARYAHVSPY